MRWTRGVMGGQYPPQARQSPFAHDSLPLSWPPTRRDDTSNVVPMHTAASKSRLFSRGCHMPSRSRRQPAHARVAGVQGIPLQACSSSQAHFDMASINMHFTERALAFGCRDQACTVGAGTASVVLRSPALAEGRERSASGAAPGRALAIPGAGKSTPHEQLLVKGPQLFSSQPGAAAGLRWLCQNCACQDPGAPPSMPSPKRFESFRIERKEEGERTPLANFGEPEPPSTPVAAIKKLALLPDWVRTGAPPVCVCLCCWGECRMEGVGEGAQGTCLRHDRSPPHRHRLDEPMPWGLAQSLIPPITSLAMLAALLVGNLILLLFVAWEVGLFINNQRLADAAAERPPQRIRFLAVSSCVRLLSRAWDVGSVGAGPGPRAWGRPLCLGGAARVPGAVLPALWGRPGTASGVLAWLRAGR